MSLAWLLFFLLSGCGEEKNLECPAAAALEARLAHTGFVFSVRSAVDTRGNTNWSVAFDEIPAARADVLRRPEVLREYVEAADACLLDSLGRNDEGTRILTAKRAMARLVLAPARGLPRGI